MLADLTVLYVDDNQALRDLTAELLERVDSAFEVRTEADPTVVEDRIADEAIDCVVCDYEMPGLDGLRLCDRLRGAYPKLPIFLFTNRPDAEVIDAALDAGVTDYVRKEPGIEHYRLLANRITNAIEHSRAEAQLDEIESQC